MSDLVASGAGTAGPGRTMPLAELLVTLNGELLALLGMAEVAQSVMGAALEHAPPDLQGRMQAQCLDLLTQRLHGLAAFVLVLAPSLPVTWHVDPAHAASQVVLADLAGRLQGVAVADGPGAGVVELF